MSEFKLYAEFNVPDAETAAKAQGAVGTSPYREDVFVMTSTWPTGIRGSPCPASTFGIRIER